MNAPRANPSPPSTVTRGRFPHRNLAPGDASYSALARNGSRAAASADSVITAPLAKVTPRAHLVLQSATLLNAQITGIAARKYARWAFTGVFSRALTREHRSGSSP